MRVSEVRAGMKGFGLSVFSGTTIDRFEVEVVSILKNFNPQHDVVLITCRGANLEHTGSIAGMSGSPVYLRDDAGHDRLLGAFAFGWPMAKDPIAGVQPIEYMLELPVDPSTRPTTAPSSSPADATITWNWGDAQKQARALFSGTWDSSTRAEGRAGGSLPKLQPLATPLMTSGLPPAAINAIAPALGAAHLVPMQSGGASPSGTQPVAPLTPGAVLAVPLLIGDSDLTAIGTCTEVIGDRVFGFGHPFNNEGRVDLPMGPGEIHAVIANLTTSFKLGSMTASRGTLTTDSAVGVGGKLGATPTMAPVEITVKDSDLGTTQVYHFQAAIHPKFTPLLAGAALTAAAGGASDFPQYNTVDWAIDLDFVNGRTIHMADRGMNVDLQTLTQLPSAALAAAAENPFERVPLKRMTGTITISRQVQDATIVDVSLPRSRFKPGETARAFVTYKPFRAPEVVLPINMELPKDLPAGNYRLVVSDADRFSADELQNRPFRFSARKIQDVFDVIQEAVGPRHDAIYIRLVRQSDGVAVGRTALPLLPGSRRQVLLEAGRSDTTAFVSSATKVVPLNRVVNGQAEFQITIEVQGKPAAHGRGSAASRPAIVGNAGE